jgi:hypothetical protein
MAMAKDIRLNAENDLEIFNGDFIIDESEMQEVGIILQMNQGELKSDPLTGANMKNRIRGVYDKLKLQRHIETQLEMDDKDYDAIKDKLIINQ